MVVDIGVSDMMSASGWLGKNTEAVFLRLLLLSLVPALRRRTWAGGSEGAVYLRDWCCGCHALRSTDCLALGAAPCVGGTRRGSRSDSGSQMGVCSGVFDSDTSSIQKILRVMAAVRVPCVDRKLCISDIYMVGKCCLQVVVRLLN